MLLIPKEFGDQDPFNLTFKGSDDQSPNKAKRLRATSLALRKGAIKLKAISLAFGKCQHA